MAQDTFIPVDQAFNGLGTTQHILTIQEPGHRSTDCVIQYPGSPKTLVFACCEKSDREATCVGHFSAGFTERQHLFSFYGGMKIETCVAGFGMVCRFRGTTTCLGGQGIGARAAAGEADHNTEYLVLLSYPLHKRDRDQLCDEELIALPPHVRAIFVGGDTDKTCDIDKLDEVRGKMRCPSWRIILRGASQNLKMKDYDITAPLVEFVGTVVERWLDEQPSEREAEIAYEAAKKAIRWSGWKASVPLTRPTRSTGARARTQLRRTPSKKEENDTKVKTKAKTKKDTTAGGKNDTTAGVQRVTRASVKRFTTTGATKDTTASVQRVTRASVKRLTTTGATKGKRTAAVPDTDESRTTALPISPITPTPTSRLRKRKRNDGDAS
ncbi:hypothetical protein MMC19_003489 [Ptychographa xylographoides]|nr:hypothetical protein [Ptychographa xylographoides]